MGNYVIGLDVGTTGTKAAVLRSDGTVLGKGYREYELRFGKNGEVEQSAQDWYLAASEAIPEAIIFADVSNYDEAVNAVKLGADIVGPTLYGYTAETKHIENPDMRAFAQMCRDLKDEAYVIMEGHIYTPEDAIKCLYLGAHAVVVGSAITRPHYITKRFTDLISGYQNDWRAEERRAH